MKTGCIEMDEEPSVYAKHQFLIISRVSLTEIISLFFHLFILSSVGKTSVAFYDVLLRIF